MSGRVRVLVTDDSLFVRSVLKKILGADPRVEVIGEARDGRDAVEKVVALGPDVVTMDCNMPALDGIAAVREIVRRRPTPVVMLSAHTTAGARETLAALEAGAVDFLAKPSGEVSAELTTVARLLVEKVVAAAGARVQASAPITPPAIDAATAAPSPPSTAAPRARSSSTMPIAAATGALGPPAGAPHGASPSLLPSRAVGTRVAVVAVSTGGPAALGRVLPRLPRDLGLAVLVVQHMPSGFTAALAERLAAQSQVRVREARDGDRPRPGEVLIAPGDRHLEVGLDGTLRVVDGPEVNGVRPSADVTMRAAARAFGKGCVGVVMTGMGKDGAEGLAAIRRAGGPTLAQDQASCVVWGMPRAAADLGAVGEVVALDQIAARLAALGR